MGVSLLIAIILLVIVLAGVFSYRVNAAYQGVGSFVAGLAALLLFLIAIRVIHL